jgi:predicted metal-dependent phosphoesterase TrpH
MLNDKKTLRWENVQVKADLHVHTIYSHDALITPRDLVFYAKKRGLTAVAVTDHDRIDGALKIARETDFLIIPGTEVSSRNGHIIGLNVQEPVPKGLSPDETVEKIHGAGGIAVACHPFALFKGSLGKHASAKFDAVETINSQAFPFNRCVRKATQIAESLRLPRVAGTDAHYGPAIGYAYTLIDAEPSVDAIAKAIVKGQCQPFGKPVPLTLTLKKQIEYMKRKLFSAR